MLETDTVTWIQAAEALTYGPKSIPSGTVRLSLPVSQLDSYVPQGAFHGLAGGNARALKHSFEVGVSEQGQMVGHGDHVPIVPEARLAISPQVSDDEYNVQYNHTIYTKQGEECPAGDVD